jgi:hypothetical protein
MKEEKLKPHKYYVVFAVRKPDDEDIAAIKEKLGPNADKYPAEFACKISMLVHNIEDESFAVYVCQSLLDQEKHAHLHYTEQGNCLHEYAVDDCDICKQVIMKKFSDVIAKKTGKEIVNAKEIAGVGVVFAKDSDKTIEDHEHPEHN